MTKNEITYAINLALEAVEASKVGPIRIQNELGDNVFDLLALNTYYSVLANTLPKNMTMTGCPHEDTDCPHQGKK